MVSKHTLTVGHDHYAKALDHYSLFSILTPHLFYSFRMADARNKFTQPNEDTPFGRHLKEVTNYLNIGVPSFTGT